jgi:hypothetical protein
LKNHRNNIRNIYYIIFFSTNKFVSVIQEIKFYFTPITPTKKKNKINFLMVHLVLKGLLVPSNKGVSPFNLTQ